MRLLQVIDDCPDELEADLRREYSIVLGDIWTGAESPGHVARLTQQLPRGSNIWRYYGGPGAISDEVEALWQVENVGVARLLQAAEKDPAKAEMRQYPVGTAAAEQAEANRVEYAESNAERWLRKQRERAAEA